MYVMRSRWRWWIRWWWRHVTFRRQARPEIKKENVNVTYADVAGCDEAKKEVMEFVEFLKEPDRFTKLARKFRRALCCAVRPGR